MNESSQSSVTVQAAPAQQRWWWWWCPIMPPIIPSITMPSTNPVEKPLLEVGPCTTTVVCMGAGITPYVAVCTYTGCGYMGAAMTPMGCA